MLGRHLCTIHKKKKIYELKLDRRLYGDHKTEQKQGVRLCGAETHTRDLPSFFPFQILSEAAKKHTLLDTLLPPSARLTQHGSLQHRSGVCPAEQRFLIGKFDVGRVWRSLAWGVVARSSSLIPFLLCRTGGHCRSGKIETYQGRYFCRNRAKSGVNAPCRD